MIRLVASFQVPLARLIGSGRADILRDRIVWLDLKTLSALLRCSPNIALVDLFPDFDHIASYLASYRIMGSMLRVIFY